MREPAGERAAIAGIERALGIALEARPSGLPADGPAQVWVAPGVIAWAASRARIAAELAGIARGREHRCAPRVIARDEHAIAIEASGKDHDPLDAIIESAPTARRAREATIREHLGAIGGAISLPRAIARMIGRSRADRVLARRIAIVTGVGPILGGVHPAWIHRAGDRACSLSMRHARGDGLRAIDLAAAEVHGLADLRSAHGEGADADAAYDLALLALSIRESVAGRDRDAEERAREVLARLLAPREPARVSVRIDAPAFLDLSAREGDDVAVSAARETLRLYDGLAIGGVPVRVEVTPPIRAGRSAPSWRPRAERRRELFSRWDRGIRADEEGLFSATPEAIAERIAEGARGVVIDGTCGIGSIAIALARRPEVTRVIAVDVDRERLEMARHNAGTYGVGDRIELVHGDVSEVVRGRACDRLVLDPPWGGPDYDRERMTLAELGLDIAPLLAAFAGPIVLKLPRSFDVSELPDFTFEAALDPRGVVKLLIARRR